VDELHGTGVDLSLGEARNRHAGCGDQFEATAGYVAGGVGQLSGGIVRVGRVDVAAAEDQRRTFRNVNGIGGDHRKFAPVEQHGHVGRTAIRGGEIGVAVPVEISHRHGHGTAANGEVRGASEAPGPVAQ
jgi:hypothetical protein